MTYPLGPAAVPDLAGTVTAKMPDAASLRIGTVSGYTADGITVAISDSDVLVEAAYLNPANKPLLGEPVGVIRQGNQWLVLGMQSPIDPDNPVVNASFEDDEPGVLVPTGWNQHELGVNSSTVSVVSLPPHQALHGPQAMSLTATLTVATVMTSDAIPVELGQRWTASAWIEGFKKWPIFVVAGAVVLTWYANASDLYPNTAADSSDTYTQNAPDTWLPIQSVGPEAGVDVPVGVTHMRVACYTSIQADGAGGTGTVRWDRVVARQLS